MTKTAYGMLFIGILCSVTGALIGHGSYAFTLFLVAPVCGGAIAVSIAQPDSASSAAFHGALGALAGSFTLLPLGLEGVICIMMAMPITLPMGAIGGWISYHAKAEPRLLKFRVTENPAPMKELSLPNVAPKHLHGYMVSKQGQFQLTQVGPIRTRLEGTTLYQRELWPASYWRLWSDAIIHRIHLRVLRHIQTLSESK